MISINWLTKVIYIPLSYLTSLGGGIYELDTDGFRLDLKELEDSEEGMNFDQTHRHNTSVTLSGVTYARTFEIINGYTVEFEDGNYTVKCVGSNHNIGDVKVVNSVSLIIGNSAGLIIASGGVSAGDISAIASAVWNAATASHQIPGSFGAAITSVGGLTVAQANQLKDLWQLGGLDIANPLTITDILKEAGDVNLSITCNPDGSVLIQRV